ncbi:MAG: glycosyltransferase [Clostridia bacterium]|nr:glycosyltransferase [Clostridia bacterium]
MEPKVSVLIPAFNEEQNIANVIAKSKKCKYVKEVIVINNKSIDKTEEIAKREGARVLRCEKQGKGYAMEEGIKNSLYDIIVFLDADIADYTEDVIDRLVKPIIERNIDFVKATFDREGGRVTELVAKPLLKILFPKMKNYQQPLSGMIAGKKSSFEKIEFEKDYGVDIGILLDIIKNDKTVEEAYLGKLKNISKDWKSLEKMSTEVMTAILKRKE